MPATALRRRPTSPRALVAAARRLGREKAPESEAPEKLTRKARRDGEGWKNEAWLYYDAVPEVKFAANFKGAALSKLRLFPAVMVDGEEQPVPVADAAVARDAADESTDRGAVISSALAAAAVEEMERLTTGPDGLQGLLREFGVIRTITGDSYLIGYDTANNETWAMVAGETVKATDKADVYKVNDPDTGVDRILDATESGQDFIARFWQRHSRFQWQSDANIRACLDICEELLIYNRALRAIGRSQAVSGLVTLPNELDFAAAAVVVEDPDDDDPEDDDPDEADEPGDVTDLDELTELERTFIEALITPTADDGDPGTVAPFPLRGPAAALSAVKYISLAREIDAQIIPRIEHLIRRLAQGLDVPPEVLVGLADSNHWTAWQIEDTTYKAHVEPLAADLARGLAATFLRPALRARGFKAEEVRAIVVGIDPTDLVVRPNRAADAVQAFEADALSWAALRRYLGFSDADAPDERELLVRWALSRGIGTAGLTRNLLHAEEFTDVPEDEPTEAPEGAPGDTPAGDDASGEDGGDPTPDTAPAGSLVAALVAAGAAQSDVGGRLAQIDSQLRERLTAAASAALTAALDVAGKRLRAAVQGNSDLARRLRGVDNSDVGATIGNGYGDPAELLQADDFAGLRAQWFAWTAAARAQALAMIEAEARQRQVPASAIDAALADASAGFEQDQEDGWSALLSALLATGRRRIYTPDPTPDEGEFDPQVAVAPGDVRAALALAGGTQAGGNDAGAGGGPAAGFVVIAALTALGAVKVGNRWNVGLPAQPFWPHQALAGYVFTEEDDAGLTYAGFPAYGGQLHPGDHGGCQCSLEPVLVWEPRGR